ncbi:hypothetical protein JTB14_015747 [Gonioctena quinquepunctata]|nr:hypothetical protein JTB14_015747 [Gonioctena quinquepunctata]
MNVPEEWKTQTVIPTLAGDKDPNKYDSYRPLVLAPCICKLFESMLKNRIEHKLENEKFFGDMQTGFRKVGPKKLIKGYPKGHPEPLLFNIYTASLAEQGAHNTKILQYADDLALVILHRIQQFYWRQWIRHYIM